MTIIQSKMAFGLALILPDVQQKVQINVNSYVLRFVQNLLEGYDFNELLSYAETSVIDEEIMSRELRLKEIELENQRIKLELEKKVTQSSPLSYTKEQLT